VFLRLILLLTIVPLAELYLLVKLTQWSGSFAVTVLVILLTGAAGAILARMQGLSVLRQMQRKMSRGELPADSLLEGVMVLVAAALLLTPGLMTDTVGFFLLIPWSRTLLLKALKTWVRRRIGEANIRIYRQMGYGPIEQEPPGPGTAPDDEENPRP